MPEKDSSYSLFRPPLSSFGPNEFRLVQATVCLAISQKAPPTTSAWVH